MIPSNSRYANSALAMIQGSDGANRTSILLSEPIPVTFAFTLHTITGFDRLDSLAAAYLGDASAWWRICKVNPERVDWSQLPVGETIRIPVG
jgi:hypothetical protein